MKSWFFRAFLVLGLMLSAITASAVTLQQAAQQAARQYNAKVLSARTVSRGNRRVHEIKVLTKDGVVKTVRIPAPPPKKPNR